MIPTQSPINLGTVDNDNTGDPLKIGGNKINTDFAQLFAAFGFQEIDINVYSTSIANNAIIDLPLALSNAVNNASPEIDVVKDTFFRTQFSTNGQILTGLFAFKPTFGKFGSGLAQTTVDDFIQFPSTVNETSGDPNDLNTATTIQDSINNGGQQYNTADTNIFRRTVNGEVKIYAYVGADATIGTGSGNATVAGDFIEITNNVLGSSVNWNQVEAFTRLAGTHYDRNHLTSFGALSGLSKINEHILTALGVPYQFDLDNDNWYEDNADLFAGQANQVQDKLYYVDATDQILRYLGTTNGDITDYDVQTLSSSGLTIPPNATLFTEHLAPITGTAAQPDVTLATTPVAIDLRINRVPQIIGIDYTLVGAVITFTIALDAGDIVEITTYFN